MAFSISVLLTASALTAQQLVVTVGRWRERSHILDTLQRFIFTGIKSRWGFYLGAFSAVFYSDIVSPSPDPGSVKIVGHCWTSDCSVTQTFIKMIENTNSPHGKWSFCEIFDEIFSPLSDIWTNVRHWFVFGLSSVLFSLQCLRWDL